MTATEVKFSREAHESPPRGVDILADAVKAMLGPKRRTVLIGNGYGKPRVEKEVVSIAKPVEFEDVIERTGDRTTTATVIARAIARDAVRRRR